MSPVILLAAVLPSAAGMATSPPAEGGCVLMLEGDTLRAETAAPVDWYLLAPLPGHYGNLNPGGRPMGLGVDTLAYAVGALDADTACISISLPSGTRYLAAGAPAAGDTLRTPEPPHLLRPGSVVQVTVRGGDHYLGYMEEMLGTPFLMAPRLTPGGSHQADSRLGCDCAGLAVYGRRRMGRDVEYVGPRGLERYLEPVFDGVLLPDSLSPAIFRGPEGDSLPVGPRGLMPGDLVHFGEQVSVFARDLGIRGIFDSRDLLLQSWFGGTGYWRVRECGFFGRPLRVFRWKAGY